MYFLVDLEIQCFISKESLSLLLQSDENLTLFVALYQAKLTECIIIVTL